MYLLLYFFWLILNGRLTWEVALLGLAVVAAVGALAYVLFGYTPRREWRIVKKIPLFMLYVFVLLWEILKANWAVLGFIVNEHRAIEPTLVRFTTSSSPLYLPKALVCTIMQRVLGTENQPIFSRGSGSQAPRNFHSPSTYTSTQA